MKGLEVRSEVAPEIKGSYCAWCVEPERAVELQKAGYTDRICEKHLRELCERDNIPSPSRMTPKVPSQTNI